MVVLVTTEGKLSMSNKDSFIVFDRTGLRGIATRPPTNLAGTSSDEAASQILVSFEGNQQILVPQDMLTLRKDGSYDLPFSVAEVDSAGAEQTDITRVIPVVEEQVQVLKRAVETGKVHIKKVVQEREETVDVPLRAEEIEVRRVAINRTVDGPVSIRHEGDTLIIPLLEEVLVVQKQLRLKEEVHVIKKQTEQRRPEQVTLRHEAVIVEPQTVPDKPAQP